MHWAGRLDTLGTEQAYLVLAAARRLEAAGHKVVHLEIGEPDMPTPPHVVEAGVRALRDGLTRYALAAGVPGWRPGCGRCAMGSPGTRSPPGCPSCATRSRDRSRRAGYAQDPRT